VTSESSSLSVKSITLMCSSSQDFNGVLVRCNCGEVRFGFVKEVFALVVGVAGVGGHG